MKIWNSQHIFSYIALFLLLAGRIIADKFAMDFLQLFDMLTPSWAFGINSVQDWIYDLFFNWSFILVAIVILVSRSELKSLNIDAAFIALFAAGCLTYWTYYRWPSGWIALLIPFVFYILYKKQRFNFAKVDKIAGQITIALVIGFLLGLLLLRRDLLSSRNILWVTHLVATQFPFTIIEETIFRGMLWKFLTDLNLATPKIVGIQAFLFWLSHLHYLFTDPFYFWITIPTVSIVLGIIVWRSKSITVSLIAHVFFNFLS